jgi:hypothetical protein
MSKVIAILALITTSFQVNASIVGVSMHPFGTNENILNSEVTSRFSNGSSNGMQLRYLHSFNSKFNVDGGFRVFKNNSSTLFAAATYEIFPDFGNQPQIALKAIYEKDRLNGVNVNNFGIVPTIGKGYDFWGYPAYPYIGIPLKLSLIDDTDEYQYISSVTIGATGNVPFEGFESVLANLEANVDVENSYSYIALGLSMNFQ